MKIIIGLGNPGKEYENTRHNVGFMVCDELAKLKLPKGFIVKKSYTYMNESGEFVLEKLRDYDATFETLYVVHDDLDIRLGDFKIQFGKGPRDHNGLRSIDEILKTNGYWHVRVGIDNRSKDEDTGKKEKGEDYVLQDFTDGERKTLDAVIKDVCHELISDEK